MNWVFSLLVLTLLISYSSCNYSDDTIGSFPPFAFNFPETKLITSLNKVIYSNPQFVIPDKWKDLDNTHKPGYDVMDGRIIYFKSSPEEMYFVDVLVGTFNNLDPTKALIAVRMVSDGYKWHKYKELKKSEQERIENRFYSEIVEPIEMDTHQKSLKKTD